MKIFNIRQAKFLLIEGCKATAIGYGQKDGKVYIMFQVDKNFNVAMKKWQKRCKWEKRCKWRRRNK